MGVGDGGREAGKYKRMKGTQQYQHTIGDNKDAILRETRIYWGKGKKVKLAPTSNRLVRYSNLASL